MLMHAVGAVTISEITFMILCEHYHKCGGRVCDYGDHASDCSWCADKCGGCGHYGGDHAHGYGMHYHYCGGHDPTMVIMRLIMVGMFIKTVGAVMIW